MAESAVQTPLCLCRDITPAPSGLYVAAGSKPSVEHRMREMCPCSEGQPTGWVPVHNALRAALFESGGSTASVDVACAPVVDNALQEPIDRIVVVRALPGSVLQRHALLLGSNGSTRGDK